jgi:hypothetical protein
MSRPALALDPHAGLEFASMVDTTIVDEAGQSR